MSYTVANKKKAKFIKKEQPIVIELTFDKNESLYKLDFAGKKAPGQGNNKVLLLI